MGTLTLSRFTKAINGGSEKPAQPPMAPIAAALATQAPAPIAKPVEIAKTPAPAMVQIETKAPTATIAPATATPAVQPEQDMGEKEDLKEKLAKLRAELEATDAALEKLRQTERVDVLAKLREQAAEYGFTADEILGRSPAGRKAGKGIARGPAPVKYRNKSTGDTWSGRGQKPRWLQAALSDGKKIEEFAV